MHIEAFASTTMWRVLLCRDELRLTFYTLPRQIPLDASLILVTSIFVFGLLRVAKRSRPHSACI